MISPSNHFVTMQTFLMVAVFGMVGIAIWMLVEYDRHIHPRNNQKKRKNGNHRQ
jgi:high-affinity Fe2+/Pb2+ permease